MSFKFDWCRISANKELREQLREQINSTIRKAVAENENYSISLKTLDFGTEPPELQIAKISELKSDKVHLTFAFSYRGNASLSFDVNLQVNPLMSGRSHIGHLNRTHMGILSSHLPLYAAIDLTLSKFQIDGTIDLCISIPKNKQQEQDESNEEEIYITEDNNILPSKDLPSSNSLLTKSKEVLKQKIMESLKYTNIEKLTKIKNKNIKEENKKTQVTFTLLNEAFKNVKINNTFDGSNASIKISNTIKRQLRLNIKKIIGKAQTFEFLLPNETTTTATSKSSPKITKGDITNKDSSSPNSISPKIIARSYPEVEEESSEETQS